MSILLVVEACAGLLLSGLAGCGGSAPPQVTLKWTQVGDGQLVSRPGARPFVDAVQAGANGRSWLIGGVVVTPEPARTEGLVSSSELRQVAIWQAPSRDGPWTSQPMNAVPGRDGPNETILYLASSGPGEIAFGSRASPTEGYPRPSAWTESSSSWTEVLEPREMFGGPNIVGYGAMTHGPHGFFIAGTWSDSHGHAEASVWASGDGGEWARIADPSFEGHPGETPFGEGIADGPAGVLLGATAEAPSHRDPTMKHGALWISTNGQRWTRFDAPELAASKTTVASVVSTRDGWLVAGTVEVEGHERAAVWPVSSKLGVGSAELLPATSDGPVEVTAADAGSEDFVVAGVAGGRPAIWLARADHKGTPTAWRRQNTPPSSPADLERVVASVSPEGEIVALIGKTDSQVWHT